MAPIDLDAPSIEREPRLPPLRPGRRSTGTRRGPTSWSDPFRERRDASLQRHGIVALVAVIGLLGVVVVGDVPDPARAEALAATSALDEAARLVQAGDVAVTADAREIHPGVTAALGGSGGATTVLAAEAAGDCYTLHLTERGTTIGQRFSDRWACDPSGAVGQLSGSRLGRDVGRSHPSGEAYPWTWMLPEVETWRPWHLATVILLTGLMVGVVARAAIIGATGRAPGDE